MALYFAEPSDPNPGDILVLPATGREAKHHEQEAWVWHENKTHGGPRWGYIGGVDYPPETLAAYFGG